MAKVSPKFVNCLSCIVEIIDDANKPRRIREYKVRREAFLADLSPSERRAVAKIEVAIAELSEEADDGR